MDENIVSASATCFCCVLPWLLYCSLPLNHYCHFSHLCACDTSPHPFISSVPTSTLHPLLACNHLCLIVNDCYVHDLTFLYHCLRLLSVFICCSPRNSVSVYPVLPLISTRAVELEGSRNISVGGARTKA